MIGSCRLLVTWNPPNNIDISDIERYMVYIPSRNIMTNESSETSLFPSVPNCRNNVSIQVAAINRFRCVGMNSSLMLNLPVVPTTVGPDILTSGK